MSQSIHADVVVQRELASRGVEAKTGVFGDHQVQFGTGLPIRLDKIKVPSLPYAGFSRAKQIARGKSGVKKAADDLLDALNETDDELDADSILSALMAGQEQFKRLDKLGQLTQSQKDDTLWMFTKSVENLSNTKLASVYQSFTSAKMDLLQTALQREGEINPDAKDARMAASRLFDLQALVLKEVSNRSAAGILEDLRAKNPNDATLNSVEEPESLSARWGDVRNAPQDPENKPLNTTLDESAWQEILQEGAAGQGNAVPAHLHDISAANLLSLVELSAQSATTREKSALQQAERLEKRNIQGVSVKEMADVLRQSEITCNMTPEALLSYIIPNPDQPINNIHHLAAKGIKPKGDIYLMHRDAVEKNIFSEVSGHEVRPDERPIYGALNIRKDPIGAATMGYGDASIVFKPQVAKRTTYIMDDTFCSSRITITQERKNTFYALLDDTHLPKELVTALKDTDSETHKIMDAWLDTLAKYKDPTVKLLDKAPIEIEESLYKMKDARTYFSALLVQCLIDKDATRSVISTHDNLESLIVNMSDIDGNALASASQRKMNGGDPRVVLTGAQYIETQIHGPVVPSRDIAEIRINMANVPKEQQAQARQQLDRFGQEHGVKITYLAEYNLVKIGNETNQVQSAQLEFSSEHMDTAALQKYQNEYLTNFEQHIKDSVFLYEDLLLLPSGQLHLEGEALRKAKERFLELLPETLADAGPSSDPEEIVSMAFQQAMNELGLGQRGRSMLELEKRHLPFANAAQKATFISWICSTTSIKGLPSVLSIYKQVSAQTSLFYDLATSDAPINPAEFLRQMEGITRQGRVDYNGIHNDRADEQTYAENVAYVTRLMMQSGNQEVDAAMLRQLHDVLNSPVMREMTAQLKQVASNPEIAKTGDAARLTDLANGVEQVARQVAVFLGQPYEAPGTLQNISMMSPELRELVHTIAPEAGAKMDELCPAYLPFPQPAQPEAMPSTEPERRAFLVKTLDTYGTKELNTEEFVHGRGHITRAYIFANAMCNILEEDGVHVERNAVLCGITGHDLGREGPGDDMWEEQSAQLTTQVMKNEFGDDAMGEPYSTSLGNCILRGKTETLEAMLLKSADSLDIGRTVEFDTKYFPFLGDKDPNKDPREPDKYTVSSPKVKWLREQLVKEARMLELITDPNTRYREGKFHLMEELYAGTPQQNAIVQQQYLDLLSDITKEYKDQWKLDADSFVQNVENIVLKNPDLFPVLSKYYRKD